MTSPTLIILKERLARRLYGNTASQLSKDQIELTLMALVNMEIEDIAKNGSNAIEGPISIISEEVNRRIKS